MISRSSLLPLFVVMVLGWSAALRAANLSETVILVAKPTLRDALYGSTVLVAKSVGPDQHVGFILNRPTRFTLGSLFPGHAPSQKVIDPVYLGGPVNSQLIFALVRRPDRRRAGAAQARRRAVGRACAPLGTGGEAAPHLTLPRTSP